VLEAAIHGVSSGGIEPQPHYDLVARAQRDLAAGSILQMGDHHHTIELAARLLVVEKNLAKADILLIADRTELDEGMQIAGMRFDYELTDTPRGEHYPGGKPQLYDFRGGANAPFQRAEATANGRRYAMDTLREAIALTADGFADAVCFALLNKHAMHEAGLAHSDETHWFAELLACKLRSAS
jgi:4-hydroxythreonine-4-phosphate dehydrogenase